MTKHVKTSTLTKHNNSANPAILRGLDELKHLLYKNKGFQYEDFDDLYDAATHICEFVGAKERKALAEKLDSVEATQ